MRIIYVSVFTALLALGALAACNGDNEKSSPPPPDATNQSAPAPASQPAPTPTTQSAPSPATHAGQTIPPKSQPLG